MSKPGDGQTAIELRMHLVEIAPKEATVLWGSPGVIQAMNQYFSEAILSAEKRGEDREREASRSMLAALRDIAKQWPDSSAARTARPAIAAAIRNRTATQETT